MIEVVGTMLNTINLMGTGIFLILVAIIFMISRGMTKRTSKMLEISLIIIVYLMITVVTFDYAKWLLFALGAVIAIVFGLRYIATSKNDYD